MVWCIGYGIIITSLIKKDPMDPRYWLFIGVSILLVNGFSGILYIPPYINSLKIIVYVILTITTFHLGFGRLNNKVQLKN